MDVPTTPPTCVRNPSSAGATPAASTLRVGVIGLGIGEQHALAFDRHPACTVDVLCDHSPEQRAAISVRHPGRRIVGDAVTVLRDPEIDVVSIASYDDDHAAQVITAIAHGKHVFVEKPLCLDRDEAVRIRAALNARPDVRLSSNLILRRSPRMIELRRMIAGGAFGRLFHVEGAYDYGRLHKLTGGWRGRIDGYSVVLGGAVHVIDLLHWLTADTIVEVAAFGNGIASRGSSFTGHDMVAAAVRFESGMTGTVTANFGCVRPHGHGLTVCGTDATFVNDVPNGRLYTSRDPESAARVISTPHPGAGKGDLIAPFVDAILASRSDTPTTQNECDAPSDSGVDVEDVFRTLSVCLAIDRSRLDGHKIPVEYL